MATEGEGRRGERALVRLFRSLGPEDRHSLLAFAEFLSQRGDRQEEDAAPLDPEPIARPRTETVVGAIKRLSRSYSMLDRSRMLNETSSLMAAHVVNGRPSAEVIDELEELFQRHYAEYRQQKNHKGPG